MNGNTGHWEVCCLAFELPVASGRISRVLSIKARALCKGTICVGIPFEGPVASGRSSSVLSIKAEALGKCRIYVGVPGIIT